MKAGRRRAPGVREDGPGRWVVDVSKRHPATGQQVRRRQVVERATLTEAVAIRAALAVLLEDELAGRAPVKTSVSSVSDYAVRWIEDKAERLRETTIDEYRRAAEGRRDGLAWAQIGHN